MHRGTWPFLKGYAIQILLLLYYQLKMTHQTEIQSKTHKLLSSNFTLVDGSRDLNAQQNSLLLELDRNSPKYRQLAGALAIDSYVNYVINLLGDCQPLLQIIAIVFESLMEAKHYAQEYSDNQLRNSIEQSWLNLGKLAEITHRLFPNSPLVNIHRQFIQGQGSNPSETIYGKLYDENIELKAQLNQNDRQVLDLQIKLTKLLQQHDGCQGNVDFSLKMLQLREKLAAKEQEIQQMNEQFSFEIEKYNTVYEAMKRQIEELKDYKQIDIYDMVERLQTEIVKLREEKERDQTIIRELKQRLHPGGSPVRRTNAYSRIYY